MSDLPRYLLKQRAYMAPKPGDMEARLEPGTEVVFDGQPGEHMEPVNEAAKERMATANVRPLRPERALSMQGRDGGEAGALLRQSLGVDMSIDANVVAVVSQLLVRVQMLEAQVAELRAGPNIARAAAPPPPPPPAVRRA